MRWLLLLLLLTPVALADSGTMTLLTVSEDGHTGGTADILLVTRPGNGGVFIDSFPLSRLDTQSSTRYANQVACDFLQMDCGTTDFFYTIRTTSPIVGGPSAGASIAVLTVAVLDGQQVDPDVAMTGTINSGGIIGPVGGVDKKLDGAKDAGLRRVFIPSLTNDTNLSVDGIEVYKISTLEEALYLATGKNYQKAYPPLEEPTEYTRRMSGVAQEICDRKSELERLIAEKGLEHADVNNYTQRIASLDVDRAYSRASLCFSSNIELNRVLVEDMTLVERALLRDVLESQILKLDRETRNRTISTISDLEVYNIVRERIVEATEAFVEGNISDASGLAYAQERLVSADTWGAFYGMPGEEVDLDEEYLRQACLQKITEAEERIGYLALYYEEFTENSREMLERAYKYQKSEPVLCIFTASQAKAQANTVISTLFIDEGDVNILLDEKLRAVEAVIQKEAKKSYFPLLGYSYMEYAADLSSAQPYSALLFAEYGLELSGLDMYFPRRDGFDFRLPEELLLFILGGLFGASVTIILTRKSP